MSSQTILEVDNLSKSFGAIQALDSVSFKIRDGDLCGLIGPNGSGKSTLFDCCTGLVRPDTGAVFLDGKNVTGWQMHRIARKGRMLRSFQKTAVLGKMTVEENLVVAGQMHVFPNVLSTFSNGSKSRDRLGALRDRAADLLDLVGLSFMRDTQAQEMSYGQQKLLQFAAVLMPQPRIVLLDEPLSGVNPILIERLADGILRANHDFRTTFLIVEHNIDVMMQICPRIIVLNQGRILTDGPPAVVAQDPQVMEAYLGG